MKLSYAITACNEVEETIRLVNQLLNYKEENSEIVVLLDTPKAPTELIEHLEFRILHQYKHYHLSNHTTHITHFK